MWRHEFDEIELPCSIFTQSLSSGYHSSTSKVSSRHKFCASFELPPSLDSFRFSQTFSVATNRIDMTTKVTIDNILEYDTKINPKFAVVSYHIFFREIPHLKSLT